jgi:hypothetical protein
MAYKSDLPVDCLPFGSSPEQMMPPNNYSEPAAEPPPVENEVDPSTDDPPTIAPCFVAVYLPISQLFTPFIQAGIPAASDVPVFPEPHDVPELPCHDPPDDAIELPPYNPEFGLPTLADLLPLEFTKATLIDLLVFFTFSFISAFDWFSLGGSAFCATIQAIFEDQVADCLQLAVACLHSVFSPGRSEGPPDSIVSMLVPVATAAVPIFATLAPDDDCLPVFIDLVTDLMVFIPDGELSRVAMSNFGSSIFLFIEQTEVIRLPAVWDMLRAWWERADEHAAGAIAACLHESVVPQLGAIRPENAVEVPANLFGMMTDVCRAYPQLCTDVNAVRFPSFICAYVVASTDQDGVCASLAFLEILLPFMVDSTLIDATWVDYVARQWPECDNLVFSLGFQAVLRSEEINDDWWELAQPVADDAFSKKIFCTACFAHWIQIPAPEESVALPPPDVLIPILTDLLCLEDLDAELHSSIRSLLLAYLDSGFDQIDQYLADMLRDGCLGEALRSIEDDFCDLASAVREVLTGTNGGNLGIQEDTLQ